MDVGGVRRVATEHPTEGHTTTTPRGETSKRPRMPLPFLVILDICNRGSSVFAFSCVREEKDTGFPIGVGNDRKRAAELATLRQSSPWNRIFGTAVQPRPKAQANGIGISCHARLDRASRGFVVSSLKKILASPPVHPEPFDRLRTGVAERSRRRLRTGIDRNVGPATAVDDGT